MRHRLVVRPLAKGDLDEQARYIAVTTLRRLFGSWMPPRRPFDRLRSLPEIGKPRKFQHPDLAGVRSWPIPGFSKHLIFYRAETGTVDVLRVIHTARDLAAVLGPEEA